MTTTGKILVGSEGMIGRQLAHHLAAQGHEIACTSRRVGPDTIYLDLSRDVSSWNVPADVSVAYLCAAVTSLEHCRKDPFKTSAINVYATLHLAELLMRQGAFVVFLSSNLVFDGSIPCAKSDAPISPRVEYGRQKTEVEKQLSRFGDACCVVRLTKVLSPGDRLLCGWRKTLLDGAVIRPFSNMVFAPIALSYAVRALAVVGLQRRSGIVQASAEADITYAGAAHYVAQLIGAASELVVPIRASDSSIDFEWLPQHTSLDCTALSLEFGLGSPSPWTAIDAAIQS